MSIGFWDKLTHVLKPLSGVTNLFNRTKAGLVPQAPSGNGTTKYLREDGEWFDLKSSLLDLCYPVGSFYISTKNVSPATFLGGTWASRNGYMLRGATSGVNFNNNANDGGADSVTVSSVASHNHSQNTHSHTVNSHRHGGLTGLMDRNWSHTHGQDAHDHGGTGWMNHNNPHKHSVRTEYGAQGIVSCPPNGTYTQLAGDSAGTKAWYDTMISDRDINHTHNIGANQPGIWYTDTNHLHGIEAEAPGTDAPAPYINYTGANYTVNTIPKYKNVFMWERIA